MTETKVDDFVWMSHDGHVDLVRVTGVGKEFIHGIPVEEATRDVICVHESSAFADPHSAIRETTKWLEAQLDRYKKILALPPESIKNLGPSF